MAIFLLNLTDPAGTQPERECELTVQAEHAGAAEAFAEEHNPGLQATDAVEL